MKRRLRLFVGWLLVAGILFGYTLAQSADVSQKETPVSVDVYPKVAIANPYKRTTFRFRWQIEPHEDNRLYALMYTCGAELHSSQGELNKNSPRTTERYVELTVLEDCQFMACVVRIVKGKPKTICQWAYVEVGGEQ